jgi:16S rRNA (cytosine967-C5)-methyltransferase
VIETQICAAAIVLEVLSGRSLTAALAQARGRAGDAAWGAVQDIAYGVLRQLGLLRAVLAALLTRPLTDRDVEALLVVALYQLHSTRAAPHAVVDHAVQACARLRKASAKGLVNAVLRNFLRRSETLLAQARGSDEGRWSYPQWWVDRLRRDWPERYASILEAGNTRPPMTLRVNARRISRSDYVGLLEGVEVEEAGPCALLLRPPRPVEELPGFDQGLVSVQDLAAQFAAPLLDLHAGQRVLDACAAPGGKTAHMLEGAEVQVTAIDSDAQRLTRVQATLERLQLSARLVCADAGDAAAWWDGVPYDRILLDAPCTASGVVRRHPDIKWLRRPADIAALVGQQQRLLEALWHTLAAGGKLLYATCSVFPAENQLQIRAFLQAHPEAKLLPLSGIPEGPKIGNIQGQILPDTRHDGFFYALLQKA